MSALVQSRLIEVAHAHDATHLPGEVVKSAHLKLGGTMVVLLYALGCQFWKAKFTKKDMQLFSCIKCMLAKHAKLIKLSENERKQSTLFLSSLRHTATDSNLAFEDQPYFSCDS